tara:strand:- start:357 stop:1097 length:741 start_codon:yes stop_codon:yes gene_type:complete
MDKQEFERHLNQEHRLHPFFVYIEEFVYGGTDGIVTTFAVVSGFSGANLGAETLNLSVIAVLLFGVANLLADGAAMGLGNVLAVRSSQRLYHNVYQQELKETKDSRDYEIAETVHLFEQEGFSLQDSQQLTQIVAKNPDFWVKFMVQREAGLEDKSNESAVKNGLATFMSFVLFGSIPLLPYFFGLSLDISFYFSIGCTVVALVLLGWLQSIVTKVAVLIAVFETLCVGGIAACIAYIVGVLFKVL